MIKKSRVVSLGQSIDFDLQCMCVTVLNAATVRRVEILDGFNRQIAILTPH